MKTLIRWLFAALLVALPAAILLTGWTEAIVVAKAAVCVYATVTIAAVIAIAITLHSAKNWSGEDFGEKHHKWLIGRALENAKMTTFQANYHAIRAIPSAILFFALGLPLTAMLVIIVSVAIYVTDGAVNRYADVYGGRATTRGNSRKHYADNPS
jgi:hypothetical protein